MLRFYHQKGCARIVTLHLGVKTFDASEIDNKTRLNQGAEAET